MTRNGEICLFAFPLRRPSFVRYGDPAVPARFAPAILVAAAAVIFLLSLAAGVVVPAADSWLP
jgi:hypothetical protein